MQKVLFILACLASSVRAAGPTLNTGKLQPAADSNTIPVKDFSVLMTFSERVQKGTGTITVRPCAFTDSGTCTGGCTWDTANSVCKLTTGTQLAHTAGCAGSSGKMEFFNDVVLVPITTELGYNLDQHVNVPSTCFKGTDGETLAADYFAATYKFKTDVSARCSVSTSAPQRLSGDTTRKDTTTYVPLSPVADAWVTSTQKWTMYFAESVQAGAGMISIKETSGSKAETLIQNFTAANSWVKFKGVGKIELSAAAFGYQNGREYVLSLGSGAFMDSHSNLAAAAYTTSNTKYAVKVSTNFDGGYSGGYAADGWFPKAGCCNASFNFTANDRLVWAFQDEVIPRSAPAGSVKLCSSWAPDDACKSPVSLATGDMVFLGKKVILNPQGKITGTTPKTYNVSIPANVFAYYSGMSASSDRSWTYSFTASLGSFDFTPPELVVGLVDCSGDGDLVGSDFYTDTCDNNGDGTSDFKELYDSLTPDGNTALRTASKFKLYFKEKVTFGSAGMKAVLRADDGSAAENVLKSASKVEFYDSSSQDCSVTISPVLKTGKKYTLSIASGEIVDYTPKNPYAGTSFTFYTTLTSTAPTYFPTHGQTLVPKETAIRITFQDEPRLGPTPGQSVGIPKVVVGGRSYSLNDTNKVKFQDKQILILPDGLQAGKSYSVTISKHHLRYMTTDLSFSFNTRSEDTMLPSPLLFSPATTSAAKTSKLALDPKAPYVLFSEGVAASSTASITLKSADATYGTFKIAASDTTCTSGGCVEFDDMKSKVSIYPLGKTTSVATAWVTAGKTYTLEIPAGAFTDSLTTGVNRNLMAAYTKQIHVSPDASGPSIVPASTITYGPAVTGTAMTSTATVSKDATAVMLAFNENVQAGPTTGGNSFAIKYHPYSVVQPVLNQYQMDSTAAGATTNDNAFPTTYQNNVKQAISLIFDAKVQAGSGGVTVWKDDTTDATLGSAVTSASSAFVGNKMIFRPSADMTDSANYYVVSTLPVFSSDPAASRTGGVINTISTGSQSVTWNVVDTTTATAPLPLWSNLEEYHCMPGDGKIPDVDIYWNEDLAEVSAMQAAPQVTGTKYIFACTTTADCESTGANQAFKLAAYAVQSSDIQINRALDTSKKYKLTIQMITGDKKVAYGQTLTTGTTRSFWIGASVVVDLGTNPTTSGNANAKKGYNFDICEVKYDTPTSKFVRLYTTSGTAAMDYTGQSSVGYSSSHIFEVVVPATAVKDAMSNSCSSCSGTGTSMVCTNTCTGLASATGVELAPDQVMTFTHEVVAPTVDPAGCNPAAATNMGLRENIMIAFNEVVQAGTGVFDIYSAGGLAYTVPVLAPSSPSPLFMGKKVYITPKTMCQDARRRAALPVVLNASTNATTTVTTTSFGCWPFPYAGVRQDLQDNLQNCSNTTHPYNPWVRRLGEEWEDDVEEVLSQWVPSWSGEQSEVNGERQLSGSHPFWDPHCKDTEFELSTTYFVRADYPGVVKDYIGNKQAAFNTGSTWKFQTGSGADATAPVAFHHATGTPGATVEGKVYFTEFVSRADSSAAVSAAKYPIKVTDCGADFNCATGGTDFNCAYGTSCRVREGDGSAQTNNPSDGGNNYANGKEYGMLKFTKMLPTNNRKYKFTVNINSMRAFPPDTSSTGTDGPAAEYTFYVNRGTVTLSDPTDTEGPSIAYGPTVSTTTGKTIMTQSSTITLYFNEDIQSGSGTISFCTNSNADGTSTAPCTVGKTLNTALAEVDATLTVPNANSIDRRKLDLSMSNFKVGQTLYTLLPAGTVKDISAASNSMPAVAGYISTYTFTVEDKDTTQPMLLYRTFPTHSSGNVMLYFSEAVQSWMDPVNRTDPESIASSVKATVSGNKVSLALSTSGGGWTPGQRYKLEFKGDNFLDLAGNQIGESTHGGHFPLSLALSANDFTIGGDTTAPTATALSPSTLGTNTATSMLSTTAGTSTVFALKFSEVVQKGTGKISVFSCTSCGTSSSSWATATPARVIDVLDVPLANSITDQEMKSKIVVQPYAPGGALTAGMQYSLKIPNTAFKDLSNNAFSGLASFGTYVFTVTTIGDCEDPKLIMSDMGGTDSPNAAFSGSIISMYFTETVQSVSSATASLKPSSSNNHCSSGAVCAPGSTCASACNPVVWDAAGSTKYLGSYTMKDGIVNATVSGLQAGKGYKLHIERSAFNDVAGNSLPAVVDGDDSTSATSVYVLKSAATATDTIGPQHLTAAGPVVDKARPADGEKMVAPSTTVEISFTETVQAGTGSISFMKVSGSSEALGTSTPVSSCMFLATRMICDPVGDLERNMLYSVKYESTAIKDAVGNAHVSTTITGATHKIKFTTIDIDYQPPKLVATSSGTSYAARRLYAQPQDPMNQAVNVAKGTILALTFTETVQAGTGSISFLSSTAGADKPSISVSDARVHFSGSTVWVQIGETALSTKKPLTADATYTVTTAYASSPAAQQGAILDVAGNPCAKDIFEHIGSAYSFTIVPDDTTKPEVLQYLPKSDTTIADDAPTTDVILYFSEAVQAITTKKVTVGGQVIPVDNSNPATGSVSVVETMVTIDPFDDLAYGANIAVSIEGGAFQDFQSQVQDAISYSFKIPGFGFTLLKANNASSTAPPFGQMEGASLHVLEDGVTSDEYLLLFGGSKGGTSLSAPCMSDAYTSSTGATWIAVTSKSNSTAQPLPKTAYAKTAQDESGCIWMMSSQYCGSAPAPGTIWMTCGVEDDILLWFPQPPPATKANSVWTYSTSGIQGHAIAIVGGWQLVIVDAMNQKVWRFDDKAATVASVVSGDQVVDRDDVIDEDRLRAPWDKRSDPILLTNSLNELFLIGGYNPALCTLTEVFCPHVFTDVWKSADVGATWQCLTANMASEMTEEYSLGVGRLATGSMAHDDTIFLIGGAKPNTTLGLNSIWTSYAAATDSTKPEYLSLMEADRRSVLGGILTDTTVKLYFSEAVTLATGGTVSMVASDATTVKIPISTSISRQVLTISKASGKYTAGKTMQISVPAAALKDASGNTLSAAVSQSFALDGDNTAPAISSMHPPHGSADIVPYTTITLTFAEAVTPLTPTTSWKGWVNLTSTLGRNFSLDISEADVVNNKLFWDLGPNRLLTEATQYSVSIPAAIVRDAAFNLNGAHSSFKFTTLSGNHTFNNYVNSTKTISEPLSVSNANDTAKPAFASMYPPAGATEVKCGGDVSVFMFFNEPVKWNESGMIYIVNSSNKVAGSLNITHDKVVASTRSLAHVTNGTMMSVGPFLKKGVAYTVSIPAGVVDDLNGLPCDEVKKSFTCLEEKPDYGPPDLAMVSPFKDNAAVPSTDYTLSFWFSENIQAGSGTITVKRKSPARTELKPITAGTNLTISGPKLTIMLDNNYGGTTTNNADWSVMMPAGIVKDARGNAFKGITDADNQDYKVVLVDTSAPTLGAADLSAVKPEKETSMGYAKGLSSSIVIPFDSSIKKGPAGFVRGTMKYMKRDFKIDVTSPEVAIVGSTAIVTPNIDWTPGEIYSMKIDYGAFTDLSGNPYAGLTTGWTISTIQLLNFRKEAPSTSGTNFFDALDYYDGSRYGAAAVFDSKNKLFVTSGRNGTLSGTSQLNDVWMMDTKKEVHCASSIQPMFECTTDGAAPSATNEVTTCLCPSGGCNAAKTDAFAGQKLATRQVWKTSTPGGRQCMKNGKPNSLVGVILSTEMRKCPCPKCKTAPFNISTTNPMFNSIADYTYESYLPIIGHNGTLPLTCAAGYEPTKHFTCSFQDLYTAVYETPYPRCIKAPCRTAPTKLANSVMNCTVPKGDQETCVYTCADGYGVNGSQYQGAVTCNLGSFVWDQPTACTKLPDRGPNRPRTTGVPGTVAPRTTTGGPSTTRAGTKVVKIIKVKSSMVIKQVFPEGTTGSTLLADTGYVSSVEKGIAGGLGPGFTEDLVTVTNIEVSRRRLKAEARRLPEMSVKVEYEIEVEDEAAASSISETLADPSKREAFTNSFVEAYAAAEKERTGEEPQGLTVTQSEKAETKTETKTVYVPTPAPAPAPAPRPPSPPPTPPATAPAAPPAPAPAPPPAKAEEEEDSGSAGIIGGVVGGVVGVGILGGAFYMYKKKQASE